jgi:glycosyltransferase involved in cell wall biosynthesis
MKILYCNTALNAAFGGGTHAKEVYQALKHMPDVVVQCHPELIDGNSNVHQQRRTWHASWSKHLPFWVFLAWQLWIKDHKPTIHPGLEKHKDSWIVFIRPNLRVRLLGYIKKLPRAKFLCAEVNSIVCEEIPQWLPWRRLWVKHEIRELKKADLIMVVSSYLKQRLVAHGIPEYKILVNHNGVNPAVFDQQRHARNEKIRDSWGVPPDGFVFGYVGGMETFRKLPQVVKTFGVFAMDQPNAYLVVIGAGADLDAVKRTREHYPANIRNQIHIAGILPYDQVADSMACFDCAIFPFSNPYGSPQKIFEYLAMGLPVLGPEVPAVTEVFKDRTHMRLTKQDGSNLAALFKEMIENQKLNQQMAARGCKLVLDHFTWDANAKRLVQFFEKTLGKL